MPVYFNGRMVVSKTTGEGSIPSLGATLMEKPRKAVAIIMRKQPDMKYCMYRGKEIFKFF